MQSMSETTDHRLNPANAVDEGPQQAPSPSPSALARFTDPLARASGRLLTRLRSKGRRIAAFVRTRAGPAFNRGGEAAAKRGRQGIELSLNAARNHALPWLKRTGGAMREHARPSIIKRDYRAGLLFLHEKLFDRQVEELTFVSSNAAAPTGKLQMANLTRLKGPDYRPTPRLVFRWAMESIPEKPEDYAFVDFGAGRGRVLLLASHLNFARIVGVEFSEELHNDCEMNIAQYPRSLMKCRNVECVLQDAASFEFPDGPTIFYFFHPFDEKVMAEVLERIARSYDRNPRRIYLVCVDMPDGRAIEDLGIFGRFHLPGLKGLKVSAMSPYPINIYRTAT